MSYFRLELDQSDFPRVAAVQSQIPDIRLCWQLNKFLGFNLTRTEDVLIGATALNNPEFPHFFEVDEAMFRTLRLIGNESGKAYLLPELGNTQFLLIGEGFQEGDWLELLEKVDNLPDILSCVNVDIHHIKHTDRLMF